MNNEILILVVILNVISILSIGVVIGIQFNKLSGRIMMLEYKIREMEDGFDSLQKLITLRRFNNGT